MASSQAKTGRERLRMREKRKFSSWTIPIGPGWRKSRKIAKKFKKLKKHPYGFFTSQNGTGEDENETKRKFSIWTIPTGPGRGNSRKTAKKWKKNRKTSLWFLFKPKQERTGWEWEKKNILVPIHSNPSRNKEFQKNSKKIWKMKKHRYGFFSSQNGMRQAYNERKKIFSFWSIPTRPGIGNSRKIVKKLKKL